MAADFGEFFKDPDMIDERFDNSLAIQHAFYAGLSYMNSRLSSYIDLLDLELDDSPAGQIYLKESKIAINGGNQLLEQMNRLFRALEKDYDNIDLSLLVNGVCNRITKTGQMETHLNISELEKGSCFVHGNLLQLQEMFFSLPNLLHQPDAGDQHPVYLNGVRRTFDSDYFLSRKSRLDEGEYYVFSAGAADHELDADDLISIFEKQVLSENIILTETLLFVIGVIRLHGGELFCLKSDTQLSTITVMFPVDSEDKGIFYAASIDDEQLKGEQTILVVDDEDIIWDVVIDMLQNLGYTVILAENGRDCVEIYRDNQSEIDLVLLDMLMPEMNGHDAFFALRDIDPKVNVLLSSGYVNEDDAQDVLDAGAVGFLQKPYKMIDLAKRLKTIFK